MNPINAKDLGNSYYDVIQNRNATYGKQYNLSGREELAYICILKEISLALNRKILFIYLPIWFCIFIAYFASLIFGSRFPISVERVLRMKEDKVFSWEDAFTDFGFYPMLFKDGIQIEVDEFMK